MGFSMVLVALQLLTFATAVVSDFRARPEISENAIGVDYGRYVLFATGGNSYAIKIEHDPNHGPEGDGIKYTCRSLPSGGPLDFSAPAVKVTSGETHSIRGSGWIVAPGLSMEWSNGNSSAGWIYWRGGPPDIAIYPWQFDRLSDTRIVRPTDWVARRQLGDPKESTPR